MIRQKAYCTLCFLIWKQHFFMYQERWLVGIVKERCYGERSTGNTEDDGNVTLDGDVMEKVRKFSYLQDVLSSVGEEQE